MNLIHLFDWQESDTVSFDFDDTLCFASGIPNQKIIDILLNFYKNGKKCIIVTARDHSHESEDWYAKNEPERTLVLNFIKKYQLPIEKVYFTNHEPKGKLLKNLNVLCHYDDKDEELESASKYGVKGIKVWKE